MVKGGSEETTTVARVLVTEKIAQSGLDLLAHAGHEVDVQEGLSPEAEDYIFWWLEISPQHQSNLGQTQTIALRADQKYFMDGREVEIRKCSELS